MKYKNEMGQLCFMKTIIPVKEREIDKPEKRRPSHGWWKIKAQMVVSGEIRH